MVIAAVVYTGTGLSLLVWDAGETGGLGGLAVHTGGKTCSTGLVDLVEIGVWTSVQTGVEMEVLVLNASQTKVFRLRTSGAISTTGQTLFHRVEHGFIKPVTAAIHTSAFL